MRIAVAVLLTASIFLPDRAPAAEKYFALFFAFQDGKCRAEDSHTFVEFIRANVEPGAAPVVLQRDAISWQPANGVVRIKALRPEPGRNYTMEETLAMVDARCLKLLAWGPYEMTPCAYRMALARKAHLEGGSIVYKAIDVFTLSNRSANCVHAAAEIDPDARRLGEYNVKFGEFATRQVIRHYVRRDYLCNPCCVRDDVFNVLGYEGRCIDRRHDWDSQGIFKLLRPHLTCP